MRTALAFLLAFASTSSSAQSLHKCTNAAGKVIYQSTACDASAKRTDKIAIDAPSEYTNKDGSPKVSTTVREQCFNGYRLRSKDPSAMRLVRSYAWYVPAGFLVLTVDVVMPPVRGTAERTQLNCRLKGDMTIDEVAMKDVWSDFEMREVYGYDKRR